MKLVHTGDGSKTLFNSEVGENYHSKHGAVVESKHVFVHSGLEYALAQRADKEIRILEVGFGTGLNFLTTGDYALNNDIQLTYCGVEAFPLPSEILKELEYSTFVSDTLGSVFFNKYQEALLSKVEVVPGISLEIAHTKLLDFSHSEMFDVVYFDAFAEIHQPEMWSEESLQKVHSLLRPGAVFVTYAITGNLKRRMKQLGFTIEKVAGAPGKREMLRAVKL